MNKAERKQQKRRRIDVVRKTQDAWIADAFVIEATSRRMRDKLFSEARRVLARTHETATGIIHGVA